MIHSLIKSDSYQMANREFFMDYSMILKELNKASLFDLFRLQVAIDQQLVNPSRIREVRKLLKPGMEISYFEPTENRLIDATIISLRQSRLVVENKHDGKRWSINFYMVNLDRVATDISTHQVIDRTQLKVGDSVGFYNRENRETYGKVIKLNQKTATVLVSDGSRWRVSYQLLFKLIDIEKSNPLLKNHRQP